jgi:hypothetical protein
MKNSFNVNKGLPISAKILNSPRKNLEEKWHILCNRTERGKQT